ncbi:MAG: UDP-N-acetylglucosamine 2-epimerase (hydrolyzing) [Bacteroidetes bacterium]|nr:UDP-N-acetylglucosamine 2-epimerase (hydrolyzing) [Bacteroidota bacterium]
MRIGVLTSSRADYGVYRPLLKLLNSDEFFDLRMIVFGTHLYEKYGFTINQILEDKYNIDIRIISMPDGDSPQEIAHSIGKTIEEFSQVWANNHYDLVFAIGDRYEMFAAVCSALPFNIKVAHLHGGETTLGAIDNVFRHSISLMSHLHFTATEIYTKRIKQIIDSAENVFNVGALSLDNIMKMKLLSVEDFFEKYNIDLNIPSILITFHPETVGFEKNEFFVAELTRTLEELSGYQLIITMPNADTKGLLIREKLQDFIRNNTNAIGVESFGSLGYLSCMKHCVMLLGNTSSGMIEATGFNKPVINIGDRQKGRLVTPNIISCKIIKADILSAIEKATSYNQSVNLDMYGDGTAAEKIVEILKNYETKQL